MKNIIKNAIEHKGLAFVDCASDCPSLYGRLNRLGDASIMMHAMKTLKRKSIPYSLVHEEGYLITESYLPRLKYLDIVDKVYFKED